MINNQSISYISSVLIVLLGTTGTILYYNRKSKEIKQKNHKVFENINSTELVSITSNEIIESSIGQPHPSAKLDEYEGCIYLDYNATSPIYPEVTKAMLPFLSVAFGNPSSNHIYGKICQKGLNIARENIRQLINASNVNTIYFTSCGSESDNRAIDIAIYNYTPIDNLPPHIITSSIEHPAIIYYLKHLLNKNIIQLDIAPVDKEGFVNPKEIYNLLKTNTILITIMHSNNEIGTIQPIKLISQYIKAYSNKILLHIDAAQSLGKVLIDVESIGVDMVTIVGHKLGAPKGVSALYIREGINICPMLYGGGQERGVRAGTENVLLNVGLGEACRIAFIEADNILLHLLTMKIRLISKLISSFKNKPSDFMRFNGPNRSNNPLALSQDLKMLTSILNTSKKSYNLLSNNSNNYSNIISTSKSIQDIILQLPNTVSVSFKNINSSIILEYLSNKVACSAGASCHTNESSYKVSDILLAIGIPIEYSLGTLRLSLGRHTTSHDIDIAVSHIVDAINNVLK